MANIQVTFSASLNNARSESVVVIDPRNPQRMVAASKKFQNIINYDFTIATAYSTDGGATWSRVFAYDYDSSGKLDHLVLYRPGTGAVFILKKT